MVSQAAINYFNIEERFSRFFKALSSSFYNRPEVSSFIVQHTHRKSEGVDDWEFKIKNCCVVQSSAQIKNGSHWFDCWIKIYPELTIDHALFPQYIKPSRNYRDDLRKDSTINQFEKNGYVWTAPKEPVVEGDRFEDESWQLMMLPKVPAEAHSLLYRLDLTEKTTEMDPRTGKRVSVSKKHSIQISILRGRANEPVEDYNGYSLSRRQQDIYGQRSPSWI